MVRQGDQVEQRHNPEGLGRLHPQAAEGAATGARDGGPAAAAGDHQPLAAAAHPGEERAVLGLGAELGCSAGTRQAFHRCVVERLRCFTSPAPPASTRNIPHPATRGRRRAISLFKEFLLSAL